MRHRDAGRRAFGCGVHRCGQGERDPRRPDQLLEQVEALDRQVREFEPRIQATFKPTPVIQLLLTLPGVGLTLAVVIALEVGDVTRFATAEKLAGYAGTTPRVHASGGKTRFGPSRPDVNRDLKWAFVEAANAIGLTRRRAPHRHVGPLYERLGRRKGHARATGAVARHLVPSIYSVRLVNVDFRSA
jgi:transposase